MKILLKIIEGVPRDSEKCKQEVAGKCSNIRKCFFEMA